MGPNQLRHHVAQQMLPSSSGNKCCQHAALPNWQSVSCCLRPRRRSFDVGVGVGSCGRTSAVQPVLVAAPNKQVASGKHTRNSPSSNIRLLPLPATYLSSSMSLCLATPRLHIHIQFQCQLQFSISPLLANPPATLPACHPPHPCEGATNQVAS